MRTLLAERNATRHRLLIWKTQSPGGCSANLSRGVAGADYESVYNYATFAARDERVVRALAAYGLPYLDVRMLYNRTDAHVDSRVGHGDCLHYCMPGALDVVPLLLYRLLAKWLR